jgi:hypothetical protein
MSEERAQERSGWFGRKFDARFKLRLAGAASGVLLALLIAPATRRLLLTQVGLMVPVPATIASVAGGELGMNPDPYAKDIAFRVAHSLAARHPDDLQLQLADANLGEFQSVVKVRRLRALESRFSDRPALYANILRYESQGEIRPRHLAELCALTGNPMPTNAAKLESQNIDPVAYAAYDRDAAIGEQLDPDNAYFPFMRAVGLFGAGHDAEALAEVERAADRPQWREYYNEELKGQWRLQDESCVNNSALFHSMLAAATLFPQYAELRAVVRVTTFAAMRAEQAGRIDEGLTLRKQVLRLGNLLRAQSGSLIGSLVGIAFTEIATERPAGAAPLSLNDGHKAPENREKQRRQFDAYLQHIGHAGEIDAFQAAQQTGDEVKDMVAHDSMNELFDRPIQSVLYWWTIDLLTLSNILWLLVCGGLATLFLRLRGSQSGQVLPRQARWALPLGLVAGACAAPCLVTCVSPFFQAIAFGDRTTVLFAGLVPALLLLVLPAATGRERWQRLGIYGGSLLGGLLLTGFYFWQLRGAAGIVGIWQIYYNLSGYGGQIAGPDPRAAVLWGAAVVSLLVLVMAAIISRACRVPLSVGIARGFRGLMVPMVASLFLLYGGLMLGTVRAEAALQYGLDRTIENERQYISDFTGKLWPRSDVAKKMVEP